MKTKPIPAGLVRVATRERRFIVTALRPTADGLGKRRRPTHQRAATIELFVDVNAIIDRLAERAALSRRGRSEFMHGAVVVVAHNVTDEPLEADHA